MNHHAQVQSLCLQAVDVFNSLYDGAVIQASPMSVPGASAFAIDCRKTQHRLVVTTLDKNLEMCSIAMVDLKDPSSDTDHTQNTVPVAELTVLDLVQYMETEFGK